MSPAEVGWRVGVHVRAAWEARRAGRDDYRPLPTPRGAALRGALREATRPLVPSEGWRAELPFRHPVAAAGLEARARRIREGEIPLFSEWVRTGPRPDWHRDPSNGRRVPRRPAAHLDYRDAAAVGDARRLWELHRHHHLGETALAAWVSRDPAGADFAVGELIRWCDDNPPLVGLAWSSSLELAIRTLSWAQVLAFALDLEAPALDDPALERLVGAWVRQVRFVRAHDSRYSSANNHRIGEAAAVATAGCLLPFLPEAEAWWRWGRAVLEEGLLLQIHADGVGKEQAFGYQRFVLDFAFWVWTLARARGEELSPEVRQRLERASEFLAAVTRPDGSVFPVGDDDEGRAVSFGEEYAERTRATLEVASRLFGRAEWADPACARAGWLSLPERPAGGPTTGTPAGSAVSLRAFRDGGYVVVRGGEGPRARHLLLDAGPLGYGPLAAHGHADVLSLALWGGEDLLSDAGTGSYHAHPAWREALRGTEAHNTASVDGSDSSERRGLFLWGRRAEGRLLGAGADGDWFVLAGDHDGFRGVGVPLTRRVVLGVQLAEDWVLLVVDEFFGCGRHRLRVPWHAAGGVSTLAPTADGALWQVRYSSGWHLLGRAVLLASDETSLPKGERAGEAAASRHEPASLRREPAWRSLRFGERLSQERCVLEGEVPLPAAAVWVLRLTSDARAAERGGAPVLRPARGGLALALEGPDGARWRGLVTHPREAAVEEQGVRLDGRAAAWVEGGGATVAGRAVVAGAVRLQSGLFTWNAETTPLTGVLRSRPEARSFVPPREGEGAS